MCKRKLILATTLCVITIFTLSVARAWAQSNTRIQFPPGRDTVTLKGTVGESNKDYVLRASEGQRIYVNLNSPDPYGRFNIYRTNYDERLGDAGEMILKDATGWNGIFEADGDYHLYVFNPNGKTTPFTLEVTLLPAGFLADDFEGYFELRGKAAKGLEGFQGIEMTTVDFRPNGRPLQVKPHGDVRAHGLYRMASIKIDGANLSFETLAQRGVSYQFTGTLSRGNRNDPNASPFVLKGHLIKKLNERKVAEADVKLELVEGVD